MAYQGTADADVTPHTALALPGEPTQQQKCAELAQAMGYTEKVELWEGTTYHAPNGKRKPYWPDYFTDHKACYALKVWLASDDWRWFRFAVYLRQSCPQEGIKTSKLCRDDYTAQYMLTANPAIIAEAAWLSLQSTKQETT